MNSLSGIVDGLRRIRAEGRTIGPREVVRLRRAVRPSAMKGNPAAVALVDLLERIRPDANASLEESERILEWTAEIAAQTPRLEDYVREIPDFPKPGVLFRDVTGILDHADGFALALDLMEQALAGTAVDLIAAPESRGFIFGAALADRLGVAFAPIRKPGKLPRETVSEKYDLEYGTAELHAHTDAIAPGERVVIVDDLLATGGTAAAAARLVERLGGKVVKIVFPIELEGFAARTGSLAGYDVVSLVKYPGK